MPERIDLSAELQSLETLRRKVRNMPELGKKERLELYYRIRWSVRSAAFKNPLLDFERIIFMKRHRFICQMLHEYMGYFYDYGDIEGGGVYILEEPGQSFKTSNLTDGRLPRGNYTTLSLSYDAPKIYFAFAERAPKARFLFP